MGTLSCLDLSTPTSDEMLDSGMKGLIGGEWGPHTSHHYLLFPLLTSPPALSVGLRLPGLFLN